MLLLAAALMLPATLALAETITAAEIQAACGTSNTASSCTVTGEGTVTSLNGNVSWKTLNAWTGIGVGGGGVDAEIDGTEAIELEFDSSSVISSFELVFLYEPPTYGDVEYGSDSDESAYIEAFYGGASIGVIMVNVTNFTTATVSGGGTISNLSVGDSSGGGAWLVSNPFGSQLVDMLKFYSADPWPVGTPFDDQDSYSDFAVGATTYRVPEPATVLLLGLGLCGAARLRRQR